MSKPAQKTEREATVSIAEACRRLSGISRTTLLKMRKEGVIRESKITEKRVGIIESSIDAHIRDNEK